MGAHKSLTQDKSRVSVIVCLWDELSFAAFKNYAFHYTTTQFQQVFAASNCCLFVCFYLSTLTVSFFHIESLLRLFMFYFLIICLLLRVCFSYFMCFCHKYNHRFFSVCDSGSIFESFSYHIARGGGDQRSESNVQFLFKCFLIRSGDPFYKTSKGLCFSLHINS